MTRSCVMLLLGACLCMVCAGGEKMDLQPLKPKQYTIGIAPSHITTPPGPLLKDRSQWRTVANAVDLYKYYGVQLLDTKWATSLDADDLADLAKKEKILLGCEFGDFHLGKERIPDHTLFAFKQLDPIVKAGGTVSSIHLDGPIRRMLKGFQKSPTALPLDKIAEKLTTFWKAIRAKYPDIRIGLITNLPNWDYTKELVGFNGHYTDRSRVTYLEALSAVHKALKKAGDKMDFVEVDCPYNYYRATRTRNGDAAVDNGAKLRHLQKWCEERKVLFHLVVNAEPRGQGGKGFHDQTCAYVRHLRRDRVFPDVFIIQSWYKQPDKHLPETEANTFMNTAKDAAGLVRKLYPRIDNAKALPAAKAQKGR